tara:strand:+ start:450 stop:1004 length:555 start_codon:yes stop_codon:yes gene_type:complete
MDGMLNVLDNFIKPEEADTIESYLLGPDFPWYLQKSTDKDLEKDKSNPLEIDSPQFCHILKNDVGNISTHLKSIQPLLNKFHKHAGEFHRIKANMCNILPNYTSESYQKIHHDRKEKGEKTKKSHLYYVNDSDGDTFFFLPGTKKIWERVTPKKGTMIIFDSDIEHAGSNPMNTNQRCVINFIL